MKQLVAGLLTFLAFIWIVFGGIHYIAPERWWHEWYGLPTIYTVIFAGIGAVAAAIHLSGRERGSSGGTA